MIKTSMYRTPIYEYYIQETQKIGTVLIIR